MVQRRFVVIRNAGYPEGLHMSWRGRLVWCQQYEFLVWDHLLGAIHRRLARARLRVVAFSYEPVPDHLVGLAGIRVLVRRAKGLEMLKNDQLVVF